jgi:hypothetical protein
MSMPRITTTNFWVFPFRGDEEPSIQQIPDPQNYIGEDEIVISEPMLAVFKEKAHPKKAEFTFMDLRRCHQATVANIKIKDMKSPLGSGAFAGDQGLRAGRKFIHTGIYDLATTYHDTPLTRQTYLMPLADPFATVVVDAANIVNKSRYLQHLPGPRDAARMASLMVEVAMQNIAYEVKYFSVIIKQQKYIIPFTLLSTMVPLQPNAILGYPFPINYWRAAALLPSIFDNSGELIKKTFVELYDQKKNHIQFGLNEEGKTFLLANRYIPLGEFLYILPAEVTQLAADNTNAVVLPYIFQVHCRGLRNFTTKVRDEPVIIFPFNATNHAFQRVRVDVEAIVRAHSCRLGIVKDDQQGDQLVVYTKDIANLTVKQGEVFFKILNFLSPEYLDFAAATHEPTPIKYIHGPQNFFARRSHSGEPAKLSKSGQGITIRSRRRGG